MQLRLKTMSWGNCTKLWNYRHRWVERSIQTIILCVNEITSDCTFQLHQECTSEADVKHLISFRLIKSVCTFLLLIPVILAFITSWKLMRLITHPFVRSMFEKRSQNINSTSKRLSAVHPSIHNENSERLKQSTSTTLPTSSCCL